MSLDVYLMVKRVEPTEADKAIALLRANGLEQFANEIADRHVHGDICVYSDNYTHNCNTMASAAGIYEHVWRPDEIGIVTARELIQPLRDGIFRMRTYPEQFKALNPPNGWGSYDTFLPWLENYLAACEANPDAIVRVSR